MLVVLDDVSDVCVDAPRLVEVDVLLLVVEELVRLVCVLVFELLLLVEVLVVDLDEDDDVAGELLLLSSAPQDATGALRSSSQYTTHIQPRPDVRSPNARTRMDVPEKVPLSGVKMSPTRHVEGLALSRTLCVIFWSSFWNSVISEGFAD